MYCLEGSIQQSNPQSHMPNDALLFTNNMLTLGKGVISYDFDASLIVEYQSSEQLFPRT